MTDNKIKELKRSISSWSLSTLKKPKLTARFPKIKFFNKKTNREKPEDCTDAACKTDNGSIEATTSQEIIEELKFEAEIPESSNKKSFPKFGAFKTSKGKSAQVIFVGKKDETQPTIVLTDHDRSVTPEPRRTSSIKINDLSEVDRSPSFLGINDTIEFIDSDSEEILDEVSHKEINKYCKHETKTLSKPPNKTAGETSHKVTNNSCKYETESSLNPFDNCEDETVNPSDEDYTNYRESQFYDTAENISEVPHSYEDIQSKSNYGAKGLSASDKAREWVLSYQEEKDQEKNDFTTEMLPGDSGSLPKSNSESQLNNLDGKWSKKDEILLNSTEKKTQKKNPKKYFKYLKNELNAKINFGSKDKKKDNLNEINMDQQPRLAQPENLSETDVEQQDRLDQVESLKKVFKVRGKLSLKSIVDTQHENYKETDIHIASTPISLVTATKKNTAIDNDSLDNYDNDCLSISLDSTDICVQKNANADIIIDNDSVTNIESKSIGHLHEIGEEEVHSSSPNVDTITTSIMALTNNIEETNLPIEAPEQAPPLPIKLKRNSGNFSAEVEVVKPQILNSPTISTFNIEDKSINKESDKTTIIEDTPITDYQVDKPITNHQVNIPITTHQDDIPKTDENIETIKSFISKENNCTTALPVPIPDIIELNTKESHIEVNDQEVKLSTVYTKSVIIETNIDQEVVPSLPLVDDETVEISHEIEMFDEANQFNGTNKLDETNDTTIAKDSIGNTEVLNSIADFPMKLLTDQESLSISPSTNPSINQELLSEVSPTDQELFSQVSSTYQNLLPDTSITINEKIVDDSSTIKPERKKKKIPVSSPLKSIKNFAGNLLSSSETDRGNLENEKVIEKKRKSRISPFNKEYLFRRSSKESSPEKSEFSIRELKPNAINKISRESSPSTEIDTFTDHLELTNNSINNNITDNTPTGEYHTAPTTIYKPDDNKNGTNLKGYIYKQIEKGTDSDNDMKDIVIKEAIVKPNTCLLPDKDVQSVVIKQAIVKPNTLLVANHDDDFDDNSTFYPSFVTAVEDFRNEFPDYSSLNYDEDADEAALAEAYNYNARFNDTENVVNKYMKETVPEVRKNNVKVSNVKNRQGLVLTTDIKPVVDSCASELDNKNNANVQNQLTVVTFSDKCVRNSGSSIGSYDSHTSSRENRGIVFAPLISEEAPPKPSPRTKKGRYGYSYAQNTPSPIQPKEQPTFNKMKNVTNLSKSASTTPVMEQISFPSSTSSNLRTQTTPSISVQPSRSTPTSPIKPGTTSVSYANKPISNSNKNPGNEEYGYNATEHIYYEISDSGSVPKPSPRSKKTQKETSIQIVPQLIDSTICAPVLLRSAPAKPPRDHTSSIPNWIHTRGPIPSPRSHKPGSMQSLPCVVQECNSAVDLRCRRKIDFSSFATENLQDSMTSLPAGWVGDGEQFYSGKAASIAYGVTSGNDAGPPPPLRIKKHSHPSVSGDGNSDEALTKINRNSLQVSHSKEQIGLQTRMSERRLRNRTAPIPIVPYICNTNQGSPMQTLQDRLGQVTGIMVNIGLGSHLQRKNEELLQDALYSIHSLIGGDDGAGKWETSCSGGGGGWGKKGDTAQPSIIVTVAEVQEHLKLVFQVSDATMDALMEQVSKRQVAEMSLYLTIIEAKELKEKTTSGGCNSFVKVSLSCSRETRRTRMEKDTLAPRWNQVFAMKFQKFQRDRLYLEVWHEHDSANIKKLKGIQTRKGMTRMYQDIKAQVKQEGAHLMGSVTVPLKEIGELGVDKWYPLQKVIDTEKNFGSLMPAKSPSDKSPDSLNSQRGSLHVSAKIASTQHVAKDARKSYDALLTRVLQNHINVTSQNNDQDEGAITLPWCGQLPPAGSAILAMHAIFLGLEEYLQQLSWWLVGSRVPNASTSWTLPQLHKVQAALGRNQYLEEHLQAISVSFSLWVQSAINKFRDLHKNFDPTSEIIAENQFRNILRVLRTLQDHPQSRELLKQEGITDIRGLVLEALLANTVTWWINLLDTHLRDIRTADKQISRIITITAEAHDFLDITKRFFNPILVKEMEICYFQEVFLFVAEKINPCVRPLLATIYNHTSTAVIAGGNEDKPESVGSLSYALDMRSNLWQLYINIGRMHRLGESLPYEIQEKSGIHEYHRWFSRGVKRWLEYASQRAQTMVKNAVEVDAFCPIDKFCDFSSSATDTTKIFQDIKIWWQNLNWPEPENSGVLLAKILEDICSCCTLYSDLLKDKVDSMFTRQDNSSRVLISKQICIGLNNIERVRRELDKLPDYFHVDDLARDIEKLGNGGDIQFKSTVSKLISSAKDNMEAMVVEFTETVVIKLNVTLQLAVAECYEVGSSDPLLNDILDPSLMLMKDNLQIINFERFLYKIWMSLLTIFQQHVDKNVEKHKASYFGGVYKIIENTLKFFSPPDGAGLFRQDAQTEEYMDLLDLLESLRMTSECLIGKYYEERYEEQNLLGVTSKAELVVRCTFTKADKLIVSVIMAKDMVNDNDAGSMGSRQGLFSGPLQSVDSYVKVQLVPAEWFPLIPIKKTKTERKKDPAVYEATFEFPLNCTDDSVSSGYILFTLKDYNLARSNTLIGEAVVPLSSLPTVDSASIHTVKNKYLKMTIPGFDAGYKSLKALKLRPSDKVASTFLKKVVKRLPETKVPKSGMLNLVSSDEDKPPSKTAKLKEMLRSS